MLHRDYLVDMFVKLAEAIRCSWERACGQSIGPLDRADMIEVALAQAIELDGSLMLSLAPESFASIMQVSGTDPRLVEYLARSLLLEGEYLREAGRDSLAQLRREQAFALAQAYDVALTETDISEQAFEELFQQTIPNEEVRTPSI